VRRDPPSLNPATLTVRPAAKLAYHLAIIRRERLTLSPPDLNAPTLDRPRRVCFVLENENPQAVSFQAVPPCPNCIGAPLNPRSESGHVATTPERRIVTRSRQLVYANLIWSDLIVRD
jgi:hypothetical protein